MEFVTFSLTSLFLLIIFYFFYYVVLELWNWYVGFWCANGVYNFFIQFNFFFLLRYNVVGISNSGSILYDRTSASNFFHFASVFCIWSDTVPNNVAVVVVLPGTQQCGVTPLWDWYLYCGLLVFFIA